MTANDNRMTVRQIAERLGVSRSIVYQWKCLNTEHAKYLKFKKTMTGRVYAHREDVERFARIYISDRYHERRPQTVN